MEALSESFGRDDDDGPDIVGVLLKTIMIKSDKKFKKIMKYILQTFV